MNALLDGGLRQTDKCRSRHGRRRNVDLDFDRVRVDSQQRIRRQFSQHEPAIPGDKQLAVASSYEFRAASADNTTSQWQRAASSDAQFTEEQPVCQPGGNICC